MRSHRQDEPRTRRSGSPRRENAELVGPPGAVELLRLQRSVGNAAVGGLLQEEPSPVHDVIRSGGSPLGAGIRAEMEARLGADFSDVRVHTDAAADASARSVQAHAYTVGSDVVFQRGMFDPSSHAGKTMLAHELTHVTQQRAGAVEGTPAPGGIRLSDPGDPFERAAVRNADRVMSVGSPAVKRASHRRSDTQDRYENADPVDKPAITDGSNSFGLQVQRDFTHVVHSGLAVELDNKGAFGGSSKELYGETKTKLQEERKDDSDLAIRLRILEAKVGEAWQNLVENQNELGEEARVLGIFTAPEWFFKRPDDPYRSHEKEIIFQTTHRLSLACPEMMLIPGSILWQEGKAEKPTIRNTVIVFLGGELLREIDKERNLADTTGYNLNRDDDPAWNRGGMRRIPGQKRRGGSSFFSIGDLHLAIEICGDHSAGHRARKEMADNPKLPKEGVDIQILVSHGARGSPGANITKRSGIFLGNNAASDSAHQTQGRNRGFDSAANYAARNTVETSPVTGGEMFYTEPLALKRMTPEKRTRHLDVILAMVRHKLGGPNNALIDPSWQGPPGPEHKKAREKLPGAKVRMHDFLVEWDRLGDRRELVRLLGKIMKWGNSLPEGLRKQIEPYSRWYEEAVAHLNQLG